MTKGFNELVLQRKQALYAKDTRKCFKLAVAKRTDGYLQGCPYHAHDAEIGALVSVTKITNSLQPVSASMQRLAGSFLNPPGSDPKNF